MQVDVERRAPKTGALGQPRGVVWGGTWEGGSGWRGRMYTCGRFMLMYGKSHHNILQLNLLTKIVLQITGAQ